MAETIIPIEPFAPTFIPMANRGTLVEAHIADIHFGAFNPQDQYQILVDNFIQDLIDLPRLDIISINGDLYDHKVMASSETNTYAVYFIDQIYQVCKIKNWYPTVVIIHGTMSHDSNQIRQFATYLSHYPFDIRIVDNIRFEMIKNAKILCIPELYGVDESVYSEFLLNSGYYDSAFMHGTFEGAVYGDNVGESRLFKASDFVNCGGPVLVGHVHRPQTIANQFYYCGNPYPWTYDDDHSKGYILVAHNLDTGRHYSYFREIKSYKYETITFDELYNNDPKVVIDYINKLKTEKGIYHLRVKFLHSIPDVAFRTIIQQYYRNKQDFKIIFESPEETKKIADAVAEGVKWAYFYDVALTPEERLVRYMNEEEGEIFITVDDLKSLLEEDF